MKRKIKISTAIPASMSGFVQTDNPHLTKASLKVFHFGATQDGRVFTQGFADKIAATIGGTPVVARYDEETDDFEGHAGVQSVFGFVPEIPNLQTELDEEGNSWLVTEVRLFTERHDVGRIAKKIVGHSQSLELDPSSLKVEFVYDDQEDLETIMFHDGNLIGLSVLGHEQAPAFRGSGFFSEALKADELEELITKYNTIPTSVVMETGGESMKKEKLDIIDDQDGTEDEFKESVDQAPQHQPILDDAGEDITEPAANTKEDGGVVTTSTEDSPMPMSMDEPEDDEEAEAEDAEVEESTEDEAEETTEEDEPTDTPNGEDEGDAPATGFDEEAITEGPTHGEILEEGPKGTADKIEDSKDEGEDAEDAQGDGIESAELPKDKEESEADGMEPKAEEDAANAATLNKEEREELENYRREHKVSIIDSYSEYLMEAELKQFKDNVDSFAIDVLEKELSFVAMQALKNKKEGSKPSFTLNLEGRGNGSQSDSVMSAIEKYNRGEQ